MPQGELLTSPQVGRLLGVSPRTVHRLVTSKQLLPAIKLPGPNGAFLFAPDAVEEYRRSRQEAA